jgi:serine/threonine protein kinase
MTTATTATETARSPYLLLSEIGRGASAVVYQALDTRSGRMVALKKFTGDAAHESFETERRAAGIVDDPHVARLLDADPNGPALAYELLTSGAAGAVSVERALAIAEDVCGALVHLHGRGLVHCDVKPANVLFDAAGGARLSDLGSACTPGERTSTGTPAYVSPEQAAGLPVDGRSDIYSLGVTLFELLSGRVPFEERRTVDVLLAHVNRPAPSLADGAPRGVAAVVARCLEKDPSRRYASAQALLAALRQARRELHRGGLFSGLVSAVRRLAA